MRTAEGVKILSTNRYHSPTKKEGASDELKPLLVSDFQQDDTDHKDALTRHLDKIAILVLLSLLSDHNDVMQKNFQKAAVNCTDWGLHAEKGSSRLDSHNQYVNKMILSIRKLNRHIEEANKNGQASDILYVTQMGVGRHPSKNSTMRPSKVTAPFSKSSNPHS